LSNGTPNPDADRSGIKVIARAASVLRTISANPRGISLSKLAEQVGLPRSTTHRIVSALEAEAFVASAGPGGWVRVGPGLLRLAATERLDRTGQVRPHLEELSTTLNETVDLAILDGDSVLFIDQVSAPRRLRAVSAIGSVFPAHCTANGKALLAQLPPKTVHDLLPRRLQKRTPSTIATWAKLDAELEDVRKAGIAFDREEHTIGICAVGVAIRDSFNVHMALTVPLPAQRFAGREDEISRALLDTRDAIENEFGSKDA
jgi:DNA-binding IclR family transcriptional regulator